MISIPRSFRPSRTRARARIIALTIPWALCAWMLACNDAPSTEPGEETESSAPTASTAVIATDSTDLDSAELYFPGIDGRLYLHRQTLPVSTDTLGRIETVVKALLEGPSGATDGTLYSPLPGARLAGVYRMSEGTVALDLRPPEGDEVGALPSSGSKGELASVYSLINTVVLGHEGVERVVLMWNGRQPETFSGHVDLSRPLAADPGLIAPTP